MSAAILEKTEHRSDKDILQCIDLALSEVKKLIHTSGRSLKAVCAEIEGASTKETLAAAFRKLNGFTRIFLEIAPAGEHDVRIKEALLSLQVSDRLAALLRASISVEKALLDYKKAVVEEVAIAIRLRDSRVRLEDKRDAKLLAMLPVPLSPLSEGDVVALRSCGCLLDWGDESSGVVCHVPRLIPKTGVPRSPASGQLNTIKVKQWRRTS